MCMWKEEKKINERVLNSFVGGKIVLSLLTFEKLI